MPAVAITSIVCMRLPGPLLGDPLAPVPAGNVSNAYSVLMRKMISAKRQQVTALPPTNADSTHAEALAMWEAPRIAQKWRRRSCLSFESSHLGLKVNPIVLRFPSSLNRCPKPICPNTKAKTSKEALERISAMVRKPNSMSLFACENQQDDETDDVDVEGRMCKEDRPSRQ